MVLPHVNRRLSRTGADPRASLLPVSRGAVGRTQVICFAVIYIVIKTARMTGGGVREEGGRSLSGPAYGRTGLNAAKIAAIVLHIALVSRRGERRRGAAFPPSLFGGGHSLFGRCSGAVRVRRFP